MREGEGFPSALSARLATFCSDSSRHVERRDSCSSDLPCDFTQKRAAAMGKGCITATKYFLFLFNLLFCLFGAVIMGFGLWVLLDNQSFITVLQESSTTLKVGSYILIGIGSLSMLMGFLGCIGAINEIRCLLGLYFTCLLLILIAQVTAAVLIYFQRDLLKHEMSTIVNKILVNYNGHNNTSEHAWDYLQRTMGCCGWTGPFNWTDNILIKNSSKFLYPCSCRNESISGTDLMETGLCEGLSNDWPVFTMVHTSIFTPDTDVLHFLLKFSSSVPKLTTVKLTIIYILLLLTKHFRFLLRMTLAPPGGSHRYLPKVQGKLKDFVLYTAVWI